MDQTSAFSDATGWDSASSSPPQGCCRKGFYIRIPFQGMTGRDPIFIKDTVGRNSISSISSQGCCRKQFYICIPSPGCDRDSSYSIPSRGCCRKGFYIQQPLSRILQERILHPASLLKDVTRRGSVSGIPFQGTAGRKDFPSLL